MCQRFYVASNEIAAGSDKKIKKIPLDSIIKIAHVCNVMSIRIDMTLQKLAIFIMGVYGEIICLLSNQAEISLLVL